MSRRRQRCLGAGSRAGPRSAHLISCDRASETPRQKLDLGRFFFLSADPLGIASTHDGRWKRVNPALCRSLGYGQGDLLARPYLDLVHPDDRPSAQAAIEHLAQGGSAARLEWRVRCQDGSYHSIAWQIELCPEEGLLYCAGRDVTHRRRLEESLRERKYAEQTLQEREMQLQRMAATVPGMLYDYIRREDGTDRFLYVSPRSRALLEVEPGAVMRDSGVFWRMIVPEDRARVTETVQKAWRARGPLDVEFRIVTPSGKAKWLHVGSRPEDESHQRCDTVWSGAAVDVTDRKHAEQALQQADRRKNEFLAILSHELRNPLAPIKNSLYILSRATPGGDQARRAREVIDRQVGQLSRLVDDLLDVTRIARSKVQLQRQRMDLNEVVLRTVEDHRPLFERNGVQIEVLAAPQPVFVDADWIRLAQIIANLLQNAAKFTGRGGNVRVGVSTEQAEKRAVLRVVDTGVGMAQETLSCLFQPFMQADTTLDRSKGGLGLGLVLAKELVELHGGTIEARSLGLGRGAEFAVRLSMVEAAPALARAVSPQRPGRRVLIIEDNTDAANSLREALELNAHQVTVAYGGPEGIAKAREQRPEVVLCDIGLPGMSGYEVARAFRSDAELQGTHLIALSGYALATDFQQAREAGFEQHLAKPASLARLEEMLETMR